MMALVVDDKDAAHPGEQRAVIDVAVYQPLEGGGGDGQRQDAQEAAGQDTGRRGGQLAHQCHDRPQDAEQQEGHASDA
jgi:hypothetical protein